MDYNNIWMTILVISSHLTLSHCQRTRKNLTLYTHPLSWNHANHICQQNGGYLLEMIDPILYELFQDDDHDKVLYNLTDSLKGNDKKTKHLSFWTGAIMDDSLHGTFIWGSSCKDVNNVVDISSFQVGEANQFCVRQDGHKDNDLLPSPCRDKHPFICMTNTDLPCTIETLADTNFTDEFLRKDTVPLQYFAGSFDKCVNISVATEDCWAFKFSDSNDCLRYKIDNIASLWDEDSYQKNVTGLNITRIRCYDGFLDISQLNVPVEVESSLLPNVSCPLKLTPVVKTTFVPTDVVTGFPSTTRDQTSSSGDGAGLTTARPTDQSTNAMPKHTSRATSPKHDITTTTASNDYSTRYQKGLVESENDTDVASSTVVSSPITVPTVNPNSAWALSSTNKLNSTQWVTEKNTDDAPRTRQPSTSSTEKSFDSSSTWETTQSTNDDKTDGKELSHVSPTETSLNSFPARQTSQSASNEKTDGTGLTHVSSAEALLNSSPLWETSPTINDDKTDGTELSHVSSTQISLNSSTTMDGLPSTREDNCLCDCVLNNFTLAEREKFIARILLRLSVDKSSLSSEKRKYISISDERPSAQSVGIVGVMILTLTIGGIVLLDVTTLYRDLGQLRKNIFSACGKAQP